MPIEHATASSAGMRALGATIGSALGRPFEVMFADAIARAKSKEILSAAADIAEARDKFGVTVKYDNRKVIAAPMSAAERKKLATYGQRALEVRKHVQAREERNLECIALLAADEVHKIEADPQGQHIQEDTPPVDEDWAARFFDFAKDVSAAEMQQLWARVLAREVATPSSFSLRTLDCLRTLSRTDAQLFDKFAQFSLQAHDNPESFVPQTSDMQWVGKDIGLTYGEQLDLIDAGLLSPRNVAMDFGSDIEEEVILRSGYFGLIFHQAPKSGIRMPVLKFSRVGCELLRLVDIKYDEGYLRQVGAWLIFRAGASKVQIVQGIKVHARHWHVPEEGRIPLLPPKPAD